LLATQGEIMDENRYDDFLCPINIKMIAINAYKIDLLKDSKKKSLLHVEEWWLA
jgi:hypothetical protein